VARNTWQNPAYFSRCHGKKRYGSIVSAALVADKASTKTGELILAYECPDCGGAHIGHPEPTQLLLRNNQVFPTCLNCDKEIPLERRRRAARVAHDPRYCSEACRRAFNRRRREEEQKRLLPMLNEDEADTPATDAAGALRRFAVVSSRDG
jgi:predicted RNA-binding Zn-ribbon protein involved in translation (DUF1610 family)